MNSIVALLTSSDPSRVAEGVLQAVESLTAGDASGRERLELRDALAAVVDSDPPHPSAGAAVWALGKLGEPALRPLFVRFLSRAVGRLEAADSVVWQAAVALANSGEPSLRVSGGLRDFDNNYRRAVEFLQREQAE